MIIARTGLPAAVRPASSAAEPSSASALVMTLDTARAELGLFDDVSDDGVVTECIRFAEGSIATMLGVPSIVAATVTDRFESWGDGRLALSPGWPRVAAPAVAYVDEAGASQVLAPAAWVFDTTDRPPELVLTSQARPALSPHLRAPVSVAWVSTPPTVGPLADAVFAAAAILASARYDSRGRGDPGGTGSGPVAGSAMNSAVRLLSPHRVRPW